MKRGVKVSEVFFVLMVVTVLILAVAATASAALRVVPSPAYPTIQSAVDAAAAGDVVRVKFGGGSGPNGEYRENVVIQTMITLECPLHRRKNKRAVIDVANMVTTKGGIDYASAITVEGAAAGTTIEGCTVQFAQYCDGTTTPACTNNADSGDGIDADVADITLRKVTAHGCEDDGVDIGGNGDGFLVVKCASSANGGSGFEFGTDLDGADNGIIKKSVAVGNGNANGGDGIDVSGSDCLIVGNVTNQHDTDGIYVEGDRNTVKNNIALVNNENSFDLRGDSTIVTGNVGKGSGQNCFNLQGNQLFVEANRGQNCGGDCFRSGNIVPGSDGNGSVFNANIALDCRDDGFDVDCNEAGGLCGNLTGNRAVRVVNEAFDLNFHRNNIIANNYAEMAENQGFRMTDMNAVLFRRNTAVNNGRAGVRSSDGMGNTFLNNVCSGNRGDGLRLVNGGGNALIQGNLVSKNWQDGIDINRDISTGNVILNNTVLRNRGTGIENDAQLTDITGNIAKGNRTDIAGAGARIPPTGTVGLWSNIFNTGGQTVSTPDTGWYDE